MAVTMHTSLLGAESPMDLYNQLSYEKRLVEMESQIQDLINWKKAILATLAVAIWPTSPVVSRRKTSDVVSVKREGSVRAVQIPTEDALPKETAPAAAFGTSIPNPLHYKNAVLTTEMQTAPS
jgi:hypothetical protein